MKKIILMGETGSGKTTLSQFLQDEKIDYHKTQQVYQTEQVIDTPGEFMENRYYYSALVSSAEEADVIGFIQSVEHIQNYFPPCFSSRFVKPVIGIVTKIELAKNQEELNRAKDYLALAGANQIFMLSTKTGTGLQPFVDYLSQ